MSRAFTWRRLVDRVGLAFAVVLVVVAGDPRVPVDAVARAQERARELRLPARVHPVAASRSRISRPSSSAAPSSAILVEQRDRVGRLDAGRARCSACRRAMASRAPAPIGLAAFVLISRITPGLSYLIPMFILFRYLDLIGTPVADDHHPHGDHAADRDLGDDRASSRRCRGIWRKPQRSTAASTWQALLAYRAAAGPRRASRSRRS